MKILIAVKRLIDPYVAVRIDADGHQVVEENVPHAMNPFDEVALARAVALRNDGLDCEITVVAVGNSAVVETLRTGLAMGADRALHVALAADAAAPAPYETAAYLAPVIAAERPDLMLVGKQAADTENADLPPLLARMAGLPFLPDAFELDLTAERATTRFDLNGIETMAEAPLPCLVSCDLHLAEPRPVSLAQAMKAKRANIETVPAPDTEEPPRGAPQRVGLALPPARPACRLFDDMDALIAELDRNGVLPPGGAA